MALKPGRVAFGFGGGLTTDADPKRTPVVKLLDLQNAVFARDSVIGKRNGYRAKPKTIEAAGADYSGAKALGARGEEPLLFTDGGTYSERTSAERWSLTGNPLSIVARERPVAKTGTEQSQVDAGTQNNVTAVAWVDSRGGIWWEVLEESTGRALRAPAQLSSSGVRPRVVPAGVAQLHIYHADHAAKVIYVTVIDANNPTASVAPVALTNDLAPTNAGYDVCVTSLDDVLGGLTPVAPVAIAWPTDTSGTLRVGYVDPTGVLGSALTNLPAAVSFSGATVDPICNLSVAWDATAGIAFTYSSAAPSITTAFYNVSLGAPTNTVTGLSAGFRPRSFGATWAGGLLYVAFDDVTTTPTSERDTTLNRVVYAAGVAAPTAPLIRGLSLSSRGFVDNGVPFVYVTHDVPFFSVYLLVRLTDGAVVGRTMPTIAHGTQANGTSSWTSTVSVDPTDARKWRVPLLYNEQLRAEAGIFAETGIRWVSHDFDDINAWQSAQLGAGLYLAGAGPSHYDGDRWAEMGWHYAPDGSITLMPAVATGALTAGVFTYAAWYEEIDAQGEIHRGPTSIPLTIELTGGQNQVTITGPMYRATSRRRVRVAVARGTVGNADELFRITSINPSDTGLAANGYILNDVTVDTWTLVDRMSDDTLLGQEPLYTTDGVLSNDPAPMAGDVLAVGKQRLIWTDPADGAMVRYSQQLQQGFAVDAPEPLKQRLDPSGGRVTAIGILDNAIVPFRETKVNVIGGPGPLPNPTVSPETFSFTEGEDVTSDVGCTAPRSVVPTPVGLAFKSAKGIRLIGRDRKVIDIGTDVVGFDSQDVTRATLLTDENRILFLTSSGTTLHFDYYRGQWSRFTNHEGLDAIVINRSYRYLRTDGRVFVETPGVYRDDSSHIVMLLETAHIKMMEHLQGWQKIWWAYFLGEWLSAHTLRVRYRLNYERQWSAPFDLNVNANQTLTEYGEGDYGDGPYGSSGSSRYQRRIHLNKNCMAIQFRIEDVEATDDYGASFELSELLVVGGVKHQAFKLEPARSS